MRRIAVIVTATLAVVLPSAAQAQNPIEIGVDGALSTTLSSPHVTNLSIPIQNLRVGFFTSPRVSIEPFGSLNYGRANGDDFTNIIVGVGGLYHFGAARTAPQPYVRPFIELEHHSFFGDNVSGGASAFALGAGVGVKIPITRQFSWRLEAALTHEFERDNFVGGTGLAGIFGLSVFIH